MNSAQELFISEVRRELLDSLTKLKGQPTQQYCFALWLLNQDRYAAVLNVPAEKHIAELIRDASSVRTYTALSSLGFLLDKVDSIRDETLNDFENGLRRLLGRTSVGISGVSSDYVALFGICCGVVHTETIEDFKIWLRGIAEKRYKHPKITESERVILDCCMHRLEMANSGVSRQNVSEPIDCAVAWAMSTRGFQDLFELTEESASNVLDYALSGKYKDEDQTVRTILLAAIDSISKSSLELSIANPQVEDIIQLLSRFEHAMRRWCYEESPRVRWRGAKPVRWFIDNEYHVQSILWLMLSPILSDLEDEENLPSLGPKHPRYDLGIPSLGLIIEVKFVREKGGFAQVVEQVAADSNLYLSQTDQYSKIIAFVYDDSLSTEEHQECRDGLQKIDGVIEAIMVSRPGKMPELTSRREIIKQLPE